MAFQDRLKRARIYAGLTQKDIGKKLGVTAQSYAQYEQGVRIPKRSTLEKIADAFGLNVVYSENGSPYFTLSAGPAAHSFNAWQSEDTTKEDYLSYYTAQGFEPSEALAGVERVLLLDRDQRLNDQLTNKELNIAIKLKEALIEANEEKEG